MSDRTEDIDFWWMIGKILEHPELREEFLNKLKETEEDNGQ